MKIKLIFSIALLLTTFLGNIAFAGDESRKLELFDAVEKGDVDNAISCIKAGVNPNVTLKNGGTPLMIASAMGHEQMVRYLIKAGANIHAESKNGETALTLAASYGRAETLKILLANGADPTKKSGNGTAMTIASLKGHMEVVSALMAHAQSAEKNGRL